MPVNTCFSNNSLQNQLNAVVKFLNNLLSIRLFQNNFTPTAATLYGTFVEATYNGYNRVNSTGKFPNATKAADGKYLSVSRLDFVCCPVRRAANDLRLVYHRLSVLGVRRATSRSRSSLPRRCRYVYNHLAL